MLKQHAGERDVEDGGSRGFVFSLGVLSEVVAVMWELCNGG